LLVWCGCGVLWCGGVVHKQAKTEVFSEYLKESGLVRRLVVWCG
jgi:hypothetical protein